MSRKWPAKAQRVSEKTLRLCPFAFTMCFRIDGFGRRFDYLTGECETEKLELAPATNTREYEFSS
jgi:hypothetical protein